MHVCFCEERLEKDEENNGMSERLPRPKIPGLGLSV